jgi:Domain of unknown function (DUF4178)
MTQANCPNCGAPVHLLWSGAVQTTCPYCKSILVRRDVNLEKVGVVADLPQDSSPIQIATEGAYGGKTFVVVGRILYEYEQGGWNEWHIVFSDGKSGWLSDAQDEFAVSFLTPPAAPLPAENAIERGGSFVWDNTRYEITVITRAHYKGVEGELPFEYWDKHEAVFADLRSYNARFATIDYSRQPTVLYQGAAVEFGALQLKNLRQFEGWES